MKQYYKIRESEIIDLKIKLSKLQNLDNDNDEVVVVRYVPSYQTEGEKEKQSESSDDVVNLPNENEDLEDNQPEETNENNEETDTNEDELSESTEETVLSTEPTTAVSLAVNQCTKNDSSTPSMDTTIGSNEVHAKFTEASQKNFEPSSTKSACGNVSK